MAQSPSDPQVFRAEARAWLVRNFPPSLAHAETSTMGGGVAREPTPDDGLWRERMGAKG